MFNETLIRNFLKNKSREVILELYLQKCFDYEMLKHYDENGNERNYKRRLYAGKVIDEPDEWVYGELMGDDTIFQTTEHKYCKCCGWGKFAVEKDSIIEITPENMLKLLYGGNNNADRKRNCKDND